MILMMVEPRPKPLRGLDKSTFPEGNNDSTRTNVITKGKNTAGMSQPRRLIALLLALTMAFAAPAAVAQGETIKNPNDPTPTTLYFHIFDTVNKFVINTQAMDSEVFEVGGANFPTTPDFGVSQVPGTGLPLNDGWDMNTIYGYSTAGPVEYGFIENGRPRFHPERGIAAQVDIDTADNNEDCVALGSETPACVVMYMDPRDAFGTSTAPTISPLMNLRLTVQEGDNPGLDADLDAGEDIMTGIARFHMANFNQAQAAAEGSPVQETPHPSGENTPILYPDEDGYVQVVVPMEVLQDYIPKKEAYNVRIDWFQSTDDGTSPVGKDDQFTTGWMRLGFDPDHLARLHMDITNPIYFSFIHPQVAANTLLIHAGGNSPWGTYDVDLDAVTIEMTHEGGSKVPQNQLKKILNSNEHVHGLHDEDAQMTYLWDFREFDAPLGEYTIDMTITNDAASAVATGQAKFIVTETEAIGIDTQGEVVEPTVKEEVVDTPTVGIVPALALLGAALFLARRRILE